MTELMELIKNLKVEKGKNFFNPPPPKKNFFEKRYRK